MESVNGVQQGADYLDQIWSLCTTLTSEALLAAENKAKANSFNVDRGDVTFTEVSVNLSSAREVLSDAIKQKKLIQLPITVQKELLSNLQLITKALQGIMNNVDEILNLGGAVEVLNTSIWKYGLHNLSDQVLGYQEKLNQLKQYEKQVKQLLEVLEDGRLSSERLTTLLTQAAGDKDFIENSKLVADRGAVATTTANQQAQEELRKIVNAAVTALQTENQMTQYSSTAKTAAAEIMPLEASIKAFFNQIDAYRQQIATSTVEASKFLVDSNASALKNAAENNARVTLEIDRWNVFAKSVTDGQVSALETHLGTNSTQFGELIAGFNKVEITRVKDASMAATEQLLESKEGYTTSALASEQRLSLVESGMKLRSEETIDANRVAVETLVKELAAMKELVKEQIAQATGLGQFGAFQARMNKIAAGKYWWVVGIGVLVLSVIGLTAFIATHAQQGDLHSAAFWIKLSMNIPLGFLISFCTIQYSRERRLEEEYAFKASVSVSLNPYRELIYSILKEEGGLADGSYTTFVVDSVRNVFTSPTEKIFDSPKKLEGISEKSLKAAAELLGTVVKATK